MSLPSFVRFTGLSMALSAAIMPHDRRDRQPCPIALSWNFEKFQNWPSLSLPEVIDKNP
jgi:hypothetical protein